MHACFWETTKNVGARKSLRKRNILAQVSLNAFLLTNKKTDGIICIEVATFRELSWKNVT